MRKGKKPYFSLLLLLLIAGLCIFCEVTAPYTPQDMDSTAVCLSPQAGHLLGTDSMGRDLLSRLLYGGRISLFIGLLSGAISTGIGILYGAVSGVCPKAIDDLMMRGTELFMSIPSLLLVLFLQAIWGKATPVSIAVVVAVSSWMTIAKVVRSEVRQIGKSEYILAAKTMGADFFYLLWVHLAPNFLSSIMFMVVTNIGQAIISETTLSFIGLGLPVSTVSWGSLLSLSKNALLSNQWWMIVIPGIVLIVTLVCITQIGEYLRQRNNRLHSNL